MRELLTPRDTVRIAVKVGLVVLLLGLAPPGLTQPATGLLIAPGAGIGPITLGQPISLIIGVLGAPRFTYNPGNGFTVYAWFDNTQSGPGHQAGRGLAAIADSTTLVVEVQAYYDPRYQTSDGLRVGLTPAQVRAKLGEPSRVMSESDGYTLVYRLRGIAFHVATNPQADGYQTVVWITVVRKG
ncbi:MAG TPA: hypothetical protein VJT33_10615 [bacterium]|nr:hypothetical protein [bacterium]